MREYMRELRDMKARVTERPYLFEQVKQVQSVTHYTEISYAVIDKSLQGNF